MDYLTLGRDVIRRVFCEYERLLKVNPRPGVFHSVVFDTERDHYMFITRGWENGRRIKNVFLYVRIVDGKFSIEEDWSEDGIANHLVRAGVPKDKIVLTFLPLSSRQASEFAVA
jgi:hypothetical protein